MDEKVFDDESNKPADGLINAVLGDVFACYQDILKITEDFIREWNFSKTGGWMLKIHKKNKALIYLIILDKKIKISMAVREREKEIILNENKPGTELAGLVKNAGKYAEGYAIRYMVNNKDDYSKIKVLIEKLIELRK